MGNIGDIINPVISVENFKGLKFRILLIDGYDFLYTALVRIRVPELMTFDNSGNPTHHLLYLMEYSTNLLEKKIKPIYIFDTMEFDSEQFLETKNKKKDLILTYMKVKNHFDDEEIPEDEISVNDMYKLLIEDISHFIKIIGSRVIIAPDDLLPQAAKLIFDKTAYGLISDSYNCFLFKVPFLYRNLEFENETIQRITLQDVLEYNNIDFDQFLDICLLTGNEYYSNIHKKGYGAKTSLESIKDYGSIEKMIENNVINCQDTDISAVRNRFLNPIFSEIELEKPKLEVQKLKNYLYRKGFSSEEFDEEVARLYRAFRNYDLKQGKIEQFFS
ncbi:MAG: hypothetical protein GF329_18155 [Candidatus Lokiarchaeota archaeon]|nr:hypothetical protein [Candidatus Lokiarchaeota archaeon]